MERLRPRHREVHIGFTKAETQKMERLLRELGEQVLERQFCQNIAKCFNRSAGRAGKPIVKWTEVQSWLQNRAQELPNVSKNISEQQGIRPSNKALGSSEIPKGASHNFLLLLCLGCSTMQACKAFENWLNLIFVW